MNTVILFLPCVVGVLAGFGPDPTKFNLVREDVFQELSPHRDPDVYKLTDISSENINITKCEEAGRGDICYKKNVVPWQNYKCPNTWCYYKPTHAYLCGAKVEVFQSENGYYPPRKAIYTCQFPEWPCYKTVEAPRSKSDRWWCPRTKCTHEYYATDSQYLWINLDGIWKKEWVVVKYPWHCTCKDAACKRCKN